MTQWPVLSAGALQFFGDTRIIPMPTRGRPFVTLVCHSSRNDNQAGITIGRWQAVLGKLLTLQVAISF